MPDRMPISPYARLAIFAGVLGLIAPLPAIAQAPTAPPAAAQFDPSDVYFQGYLASRSAETLEGADDFIGALQKLDRAAQLFRSVRKYYPGWKSDMVEARSTKTQESIGRVRPKAEAAMLENRNAVAELEGGVKVTGTLIDPAKGVLPLTPGIFEVDPLQTRRLNDAEAEVQRLRKLNASSAAANKGPSRQELQTRLLAAENTVKALRSRLAAAPLEREMTSLGRRIETLEQEREAMAMALTQSRGSHTEALARIATLEADLNVIQQKRADLARDLKAEQTISKSVVAGQRRQLDALEKKLKEKNGELNKANQRIRGLIAELEESRDAFSELRDERDGLLQEKEQMNALLKLNKGGRIQDLIEQNMSLAKNLREANERVDRLNRESNADKDTLTNAIRDLGIAKAQINSLHQDKQEQERRINEMKARLQNEELALSSGQGTVDPMEVEVLRDIIKRQLRVQERRRQARDLLVEAAKELGSKDERLTKAIELFDGQEIVLSSEEQKLIEGSKIDGEFVSPFARDRATVGQATANLNRDIAVFERTAQKSFLAGRMLPTRELYEMILEQHPGHTPSLCKLGVVHLKLQEPTAAVDTFRRAVELDPNNPYAYRMLGFSLMTLGELTAAEETVGQAVELAPNDAKSQILLATISYRLDLIPKAESHFKAAISAEPTASEPYYNLALIYLREERIGEAKTYYYMALERGAVPDPALEERIDKK